MIFQPLLRCRSHSHATKRMSKLFIVYVSYLRNDAPLFGEYIMLLYIELLVIKNVLWKYCQSGTANDI